MSYEKRINARITANTNRLKSIESEINTLKGCANEIINTNNYLKEMVDAEIIDADNRAEMLKNQSEVSQVDVELLSELARLKEIEAIHLDKETPKEVLLVTNEKIKDAGWKYCCPKCMAGVGENSFHSFAYKEDYCPECGQRLSYP